MLIVKTANEGDESIRQALSKIYDGPSYDFSNSSSNRQKPIVIHNPEILKKRRRLGSTVGQSDNSLDDSLSRLLAARDKIREGIRRHNELVSEINAKADAIPGEVDDIMQKHIKEDIERGRRKLLRKSLLYGLPTLGVVAGAGYLYNNHKAKKRM